MKKTILRSLSIFLAIFLILGAIPIGVSAAETTSDFEYSILDDGTIMLTRYIGNSSDVFLPEKIDGKIVTKVNAFCFYNDNDYNGLNDTVKSIFISKNIKEISDQYGEFYCLNRIIYLESIEVDEENEFYSSDGGILFNKDKTKLIYYPCCKLGEEYTVPGFVRVLGRNAFSFSEYLKHLNFNSSFSAVNIAAIGSCKNLEETDYPIYPEPSSEISLFTFCEKLSKVYISKEVKWMNDKDFMASPNVVLYVYDNSYGLEWAKSHDFPYVIMEEPPVEKELVDENTGILVSGVMDAEATLNVESVENIVENAISSFNITLVKDGNIIQPDGSITISIPSEYSDCDVFWIKDDGTKVNMNAEYVDGKYVFTTDHLSIYALVRNNVPTVPEPTETVPEPTETDPIPTETVPEPTETDPIPTETVPEPTETDPVPTETVPEPAETDPVPTETLPEPTETDPVPTETVPEPTETDPVATETVPVTTGTDPINPEPLTTEPTTTAPVATPDTPSDANNGSNGSSSNTPSSNSNNTSNGAVATGDMFGIDNSILIALILAATTAMVIANKRRKYSSK